jgi:hypothetical protein
MSHAISASVFSSLLVAVLVGGASVLVVCAWWCSAGATGTPTLGWVKAHWDRVRAAEVPMLAACVYVHVVSAGTAILVFVGVSVMVVCHVAVVCALNILVDPRTRQCSAGGGFRARNFKTRGGPLLQLGLS